MVAIINDFLRRGFQAYAARKPFTLVLGNEGGDIDSIIGSIYLAFYLDRHGDLGDQIYIPAVNFEKADLPLRGDAVQLFLRHGIATDWLMSTRGSPDMLDCLDLQGTLPNVILYDHNKLIPEQAFLEERVIGVIDHHLDEKLYLDHTRCFRRIEMTGSACTLVAELYKEAKLPVPCAELLLAPIVLDTVNFNPSQKKVTEKDIEVSHWLVKQANKPIDMSTMFLELRAWKSDILGLNFSQHFRRDYKAFELPSKEKEGNSVRIGISSISCRFDEFLGSHEMSELISSCLEFLDSRNLEFLLLACAGERGPGNFCRQVAFIAKGAFLDLLVAFADSSPEGIVFTLINTAQQKEWSLMCYELSDPSVSRKRLAPSLIRFISSCSSL